MKILDWFELSLYQKWQTNKRIFYRSFYLERAVSFYHYLTALAIDAKKLFLSSIEICEDILKRRIIVMSSTFM